MLVRKYVIPVLAAAGATLAVYTVVSQSRPLEAAQPVAAPAESPYERQVAGAGIVEASTENIAIGAEAPGVVERVLVRAGDVVKAGDVLFVIDERAAKAELEVRRTALGVARRNLAKLEASPRPEDIPPAEAKVAAARAEVEDARTQLELWKSVSDPRAVSRDELNQKSFALAAAEARLREAEAELGRLRAGAWGPDLEIARAEVESAAAQVAAAETDLERRTVRSPVDGQVLQLNVRAGEYAPAGIVSVPLVLLGNTEVLHVRVDVDENDAWRIRPEASARAYLRGNSAMSADLKFVRIEPYVVPKRSLTGDSAERVDTRVLQVLYAFERGKLPVYVGQQMDVFIESAAGAGRAAVGAGGAKEGRP